MRRQDITYQDKLNELRLDLSHPNSRGICFVLLEGESDIKLFRKFFNSQNCKVETIPGGSSKVENAVSELISLYELVIGIRDADFINLDTIPYSIRNMFLTDFHDIEMTIIANDDLISAIFFEYTDIPQENHIPIREQLVSIIEGISLLKWLNETENIELVFHKIGFMDLVSFSDLTLDFDQYFSRIISKSPNAKIIDIMEIEIKIAVLKSLGKHPFQLCNGHDFVRILAEFIRKQGKTNGINDNTIESILRTSFTKEKFYTTQLFTSIKDWSDTKGLNIFM